MTGARPREGLVDPGDTACDVRAVSARRSAENERFLARIGKGGRVHRRKPKGRAMPRRAARADAARSPVRAFVEHPFAHRKGPMALVIRTVGIARAATTVTLATTGDDMKRWGRLARRCLSA